LESFGFWVDVDDVLMVVGSHIFGQGHKALGAKAMSQFLAHVFSRN